MSSLTDAVISVANMSHGVQASVVPGVASLLATTSGRLTVANLDARVDHDQVAVGPHLKRIVTVRVARVPEGLIVSISASGAAVADFLGVGGGREGAPRGLGSVADTCGAGARPEVEVGRHEGGK